MLLLGLSTINYVGAQIDVEINPLGALFGRPEVTGEYLISDNFGVELGVGVTFGKALGLSVDDAYEPKQSGFGFRGQGKYYFSPDEGGDGWYISAYLRQESLEIKDNDNDGFNGFKRDIFAGGVTFGKKWVFDSGFIIEAAFGGGRAFSEKNEWLDENGQGDDFGIELGFDITGRLAIGYRF